MGLSKISMNSNIAVIEKNVAASGTAEPVVATSIQCITVLIVAKSTNTGKLFVGNSLIDETSLPANPLSAGGSIEISVPAGVRFDLSDVYLDAEVNGEGAWVTYVY